MLNERKRKMKNLLSSNSVSTMALAIVGALVGTFPPLVATSFTLWKRLWLPPESAQEKDLIPRPEEVFGPDTPDWRVRAWIIENSLPSETDLFRWDARRVLNN
jgi:hypothetical protein